MINHRWKQVYHWNILLILWVIGLSLVWMVLQMPKEFRGGVLTTYRNLSVDKNTDKAELTHSINALTARLDVLAGSLDKRIHTLEIKRKWWKII